MSAPTTVAVKISSLEAENDADKAELRTLRAQTTRTEEDAKRL